MKITSKKKEILQGLVIGKKKKGVHRKVWNKSEGAGISITQLSFIITTSTTAQT